jgi:electron transfer flavoprotein alpha subunit
MPDGREARGALSRDVLVLAELAGGALARPTLHVVSAARALAARTGGRVHAALLDAGDPMLGQALAAYGVLVHVATPPALAAPLAESAAPALAALAAGLGVGWIGAAATTFGRDVLPRAAARLGAAMASDALGFSGQGDDVRVRRALWSGAVLAELELATPVRAFTARVTEFPAAAPAEGGAVVRFTPPPDAPPRARRLGFAPTRTDRPALAEARVVVAGGRGARGDFGPVEALADALGGAVGATRAAVDAGVPSDLQVGQTGKTVAPDLYVAAGISGAIQHVAGMRGARVIVAVNSDPDAPIFRIADYGLVADLAEALPALAARAQGSGRGGG